MESLKLVVKKAIRLSIGTQIQSIALNKSWIIDDDLYNLYFIVDQIVHTGYRLGDDPNLLKMIFGYADKWIKDLVYLRYKQVSDAEYAKKIFEFKEKERLVGIEDAVAFSNLYRKSYQELEPFLTEDLLVEAKKAFLS